jgi:hypothetical protein
MVCPCGVDRVAAGSADEPICHIHAAHPPNSTNQTNQHYAEALPQSVVPAACVANAGRRLVATDS